MSPRERPTQANLSAHQLDAIVPPLAERERPGLSATLTGPIAPDRCRCCGAPHVAAVPLARWQECDAWDRPQSPPVVVVLCKRCSARLIEPHPRLYWPLATLEPFPGCMSVCLHCVHRVGTACRSPAAQINGGPGLVYTWAGGRQPTVAHLCGTRNGRRTGWTTTMWPSKVETCSGHAVAPLVRADPHPGDEASTVVSAERVHAEEEREAAPPCDDCTQRDACATLSRRGALRPCDYRASIPATTDEATA